MESLSGMFWHDIPMAQTTQVVVKPPNEVLSGVDRLVAAGEFANRSQVIRQALGALLERDERRRIDDASAAGFARVPETDAELPDAMRLAKRQSRKSRGSPGGSAWWPR